MPLTSIHHSRNGYVHVFDPDLKKEMEDWPSIKKHDIKVRDNGGE